MNIANMMDDERLAELVHAVLSSTKYRALDPNLVRQIGARELATRRNLKEAVKATKNRLHQAAGVFVEARPAYDSWLAQLRAAHAAGPPALREACTQVLAHHASTRERLPIMSEFFTTTLATLPPIRSVLDLACGLNPLAIPWMPLAPGARYIACDVYTDMITFLNACFPLLGVVGEARVCDLISEPPHHQVDLALALKALPTLDQQAKDAGITLLRRVRAQAVLVSFPARSLGGRDRHMVENYERLFRERVADEGWRIERFVFATELAFLVQKTNLQ